MHGLPTFFPFTNVAVVLACSALAVADDREPTAEGTLDGTWRADVSDSQAIILSIKDSRIEMSAVAGEQLSSLWIGQLNISKDSPNQHMDWVELKTGNTTLPDNKCLFRLRGDVLLVIGGGPHQRPLRFYSGAGGDPRTLVILRIDPKKEATVPTDARETSAQSVLNSYFPSRSP